MSEPSSVDEEAVEKRPQGEDGAPPSASSPQTPAAASYGPAGQRRRSRRKSQPQCAASVRHADLFRSVPLPGSEDGSDDPERSYRFRSGLELCHLALVSAFGGSGDATAGPPPGGGSPGSGGGLGMGSVGTGKGTDLFEGYRSKIPPSSDPGRAVPGLANLRPWGMTTSRDGGGSGEGEDDDTAPPTAVVPLGRAFALWGSVLGLSPVGLTSPTPAPPPDCVSDGLGDASASIYRELISADPSLGDLDGLPISASTLRRVSDLDSESVRVCSYVCDALRRAGVVRVYAADVVEGGYVHPSSDLSFFVGLTAVGGGGVGGGGPKSSSGGTATGGGRRSEAADAVAAAAALFDPSLLRHSASVLAAAVFPRIADELSGDAAAGVRDQTLIWYGCARAPRLLVDAGRFEDAGGLLSDVRFARQRLSSLGWLPGTIAQCGDCARLGTALAREAAGGAGSNSGGGRRDRSAAERWRGRHLEVLVSLSALLRRRAGEEPSRTSGTAGGGADDARSRLLGEIGEAVQLVGEAIGALGMGSGGGGTGRRSAEMEQYEAALSLKTDAYGGHSEDDGDGGGTPHESVADALFLMGRHHQRTRSYRSASRCYDRALRTYRDALGHECIPVASVLHDIGVMYHGRGDHGSARKCLGRSLSMRMGLLGDDDLSVADGHCWVGKIERERGEYGKARECFLEAHRIKVRRLGKGHVDSAEVLHNVGVVCDDLGWHAER